MLCCGCIRFVVVCSVELYCDVNSVVVMCWFVVCCVVLRCFVSCRVVLCCLVLCGVVL